MKAIVKKSGKETKKTGSSEQYDLTPFQTEGTFERVPLDQIDISPLNYRRIFNEQDLQEFAKELALHGIISPITIRKVASGRFELVAGERRYRGAKIAALTTVPAMIQVLSDEQVIEIMLAENLQRENPHPLHEAQGIERMYKVGKSIDEIAARLGKSKSFIYSRLKWAELIVPLQEIFLADKLAVQDITELSFLSPATQQEFFDQYCKDWEKKSFRIYDIKHALSRFKYDLAKAPFDVKDKNLIPDVGRCGTCPFNSATIKSLFPEMAKEAICTNQACYKSKCAASFQNKISAALTSFKPDALLTYGTLSEDERLLIASFDDLKALPQHSYYEVNICRMPAAPEQDDYLDYEDNEDGELDEDSFAQAQQEYETEVAEYQSRIDSGKLLKGILVTAKEIKLLYFNHEKRGYSSVKTVTAKEVQQAIKNGTVTAELLNGEIDRIKTRELRNKELDREKVQMHVYTVFGEQLKDQDNKVSLTAADQVAARLLVYQSADWQARNAIDDALFAETEDSAEGFYTALAGLSDEQYALMIRLALNSKHESQRPNQITGLAFYKMAEAAGVDVKAIEQQQEKRATEREIKANARITVLEGKAGSLIKAA